MATKTPSIASGMVTATIRVTRCRPSTATSATAANSAPASSSSRMLR